MLFQKQERVFEEVRLVRSSKYFREVKKENEKLVFKFSILEVIEMI